MDSTSNVNGVSTPQDAADISQRQQSGGAPPPPSTSRNWIVILVVALAGALMIFVGVRNAKKGSGVADRAAMIGNVRGKLAPDFTLKALDGTPVKLSELRGKAVLLNFWATWCEPCKVEIPWFVDLQNQYGDQGLQIVGVAMDDDAKPEKIGAFTKQLGVNYKILVGNDAVGDLYGGIENLPTTFYVGRDGKIVARVIGLRGRKEAEDYIKATLATQGGTTRASR
jgi:peroxiredoxin